MSLPDGLTLDALKDRIDKERGSDDGLLQEYLEGAVLTAETPAPIGCGRNLTAPEPPLVDGEDTGEPVTKTFNVRGRRIALPDAREITQVAVNGVVTTEYDVVEQNDMIIGLSIPPNHPAFYGGEAGFGDYAYNSRFRRRQRRKIDVTGRFGFTEIPVDLADAIYILAGRAWNEKEAQYADQVPVAEGGGVVLAYFRQLPPRTKLIFGKYELPKGLLGLS